METFSYQNKILKSQMETQIKDLMSQNEQLNQKLDLLLEAIKNKSS